MKQRCARQRQPSEISMSAIGSCGVLKRHNFTACLDHARNIRSESTGKWLFKKTSVVGIREFEQLGRQR
jgi:hypothetical protein